MSCAESENSDGNSGEMDSEVKLCKICNTEKPLAEMVKKGGSYRPNCKDCRNKSARERTKNDPEYREKERLRGKEKYQRNREKHLALTGEYYRAHTNERKELHLKKTYGITMRTKKEMLDAQENRCAICRFEFPDEGRAYVDHCHSSGKIRGLLCRECNTGLGVFKDNVESLRAAIRYLSGADDE